MPLTQYDQPPSLIISTDYGAQSLLKDAGSASGYSLTFNETETEIEIEFEPQELTEDQSRVLLNNADIYYLRTIMWLLYDPFNAIDGPPIDAWYALCDHLDQSVLDRVGAEPTILADGNWLKCQDPPPARDQFDLTDGKKFFEYKKISAAVLVKIVETAKLQRENKRLSENAKDLAFSLVPVLGPTINATRNPGADPSEVSQETLIGTIIDVIGGKVLQVGAKAGGKIIGAISTKIKPAVLIPDFRGYNALYEVYDQELEAARNALSKHQKLKALIVDEDGFIKGLSGSGQLDYEKRVRFTKIALRLMGRDLGDDTYDFLFSELDRLWSMLPEEVKDKALSLEQFKAQIIANRKNFFAVDGDKMDIILSEGIGGRNYIVEGKVLIAIRTSLLRSGTPIHEFLHYYHGSQQGFGSIYLFEGLNSEESLKTVLLLREGFVDWLLKDVGYTATQSYQKYVSKLDEIVTELTELGHPGKLWAQEAALTGDFGKFYERYVNATGKTSIAPALVALFDQAVENGEELPIEVGIELNKIDN